ncbi:DNA binding protein [Phytophthora megakarya]|uniref:DNA binding protein n=1 Tax=Phytophthora megakarya TaxID=4795 RepID=A0A225VAX5_9STRA|nr:DNA binding protein [Phytophthora megakarya]
MSESCSETVKAEASHKSGERSCENAKAGTVGQYGGISCYTCGQLGHWATQCFNIPVTKCSACNQPGSIALNYPDVDFQDRMDESMKPREQNQPERHPENERRTW